LEIFKKGCKCRNEKGLGVIKGSEDRVQNSVKNKTGTDLERIEKCAFLIVKTRLFLH
jgi:hypothetical protein